MFSQEDSPANLSPSLEEERERTITATSGHRCFERYGRYTPLGSLVKTLMESRRWWSPAKSLRWDSQTIFSKRITYTERKADSPSTKSVQTSKPKDIPSNRLLFQLVPSEHHTEETVFGLLPTVQTQGLKQCNKNGKTEFVPLDLLPTPNAAEGEKYTHKLNPKSQMGQGLTALAVNGLLLTPMAADGMRANMKMQALKNHNKENANLAEQIAHKVGGGTSQLNPLFVEEMMGFPLMWTALPFLSPSGDKNQ